MSAKTNLIKSCGHIFFLLVTFSSLHLSAQVANKSISSLKVMCGAERTIQYLSLVKGKNIALVVNQTSRVGKENLVDTLSALGINIKKIFGPEHGFRGDADAGAHIGNTIDKKTGITVISLYGKKQKPSNEDLKDIDVVIFDIQDVGCRFYTFLSTLHYLMEACAENGKSLIVLDRPNPHGNAVDGPVLDLKYKSFVGIAALPAIYGLTLGEYAMLAKGEKWIDHADKLDLKVIPCLNYDHGAKYSLPVAPSPNLKNDRAVFLYPSLCFFEGTNVSVGRGTDFPFQIIGSPDIILDSPYTFTPVSKPGATDPPHKGVKCYGYDLRKYKKDFSSEMKGLNLKYLLKMYALSTDKEKFFTSPDFFDKLAGNDQLRKQIEAGKSEKDIKASWQGDLLSFKQIRKKYLLYKDFE